MPVQLWNLGSTVYSATEPSGPGSNFSLRPSPLSGPQPKQWPSHSTSMGRTIAEVVKLTPPPDLPPRWGGTWDQALQFHVPVRCSAPALPESAFVSSASIVPVWPDESSVKTTLSDATVFCHTCVSSAECSCTATAGVSYVPGPP